MSEQQEALIGDIAPEEERTVKGHSIRFALIMNDLMRFEHDSVEIDNGDMADAFLMWVRVIEKNVGRWASTDVVRSLRMYSDLLKTAIEVVENEDMEDIDRHVDDLELSTRLYNCLFYAGLERIRDIVRKTPSELLRIRNLGRKSLKEIMDLLDKMGFKLKAHEKGRKRRRTEND